MKVLWLGPDTGTAGHRRRALERLGHTTDQIDPRQFLPASRLVDKWCFETGALFLERYVHRRLTGSLRGREWDLALANTGTLLGPAAILHLKQYARRVVNHTEDDPFGGRDKHSWRLYLNSVPYYDVLFVVRDQNVPEARALGGRKVVRVSRGADELAHRPRNLTPEERRHWSSEVLFVGTWMPERGPFLTELLHLGVPLTLYGGRWQKAPECQELRSVWKGFPLYADEYVLALQSARICLGMLSRGNRDSVTSRSFEIPSLGGLLCTERTAEHLSLYRDGEEAVFWDDAQECARRCRELLADEKRRAMIAAKGHERCLRNGRFNEALMSQIVREALTDHPQDQTGGQDP